MLPENHTDQDVEKVLRQLGSPKEMANKYSTSKKYLISPAVYEDYIKTLKIATITTAMFMFFVNFALYFIAGAGMHWEEVVSSVFSNSISGLIEGGIYAAIITTI